MTTRRHVHLEPVGGIAGDMFVAAMLDLFPEHRDACWQDLMDCGVMEQVDITLQSGLSKGLAVRRFDVSLKASPAKRTGSYSDLRQWLDHGALDDVVKSRAQSILMLLAEAEAHVHGVDIDKVHFHEVADWDSIVDVVAAASVIERAGPLTWTCGALPLGSGLVKTEHGMLPIPAPATAWLLRQMSVWDDGEPGERVTPTGAAIVRSVLSLSGSCLSEHSLKPVGALRAIGCGAGQRDLQQRPNMLRCLLIDKVSAEEAEYPSPDSAGQPVKVPSAATGQRIDEVVQLSFEIDDMTPEELSVSLEFIRQEEGVLDAGFQLAFGKKGRAMFAVNVLCRPVHEASVSARCLEETTTLGMRVHYLYRRTLERELRKVDDDQGEAGIKSVTRPSGEVTIKVESDDLAGIPGLQARRLRAGRIQGACES